MGHHVVILLGLWMTSYQLTVASSSSSSSHPIDTLLTSASSLLEKIINPPPTKRPSAKKSTPKVNLSPPLQTPYRLDIPVYEQMANAEAAWKMHYHQQQSSVPTYWNPHSYHPHQTSPSSYSSPPSLPSLLDYHYQSPVWSAALYGSYNSDQYPSQMNPQQPTNLVDDHHHLWPQSSSSSQSSLSSSPSYLYPHFAPPSSESQSSSPDYDSQKLYQDSFNFPEEDIKLKPGELPLSFMAAEMLAEAATSSSHSKLPSSSYFDNSALFGNQMNQPISSDYLNSFTNQQLSPFASSDQNDPFSESRNFENFQQHHNDQNHYFGGESGGNPSSQNSLLLNEHSQQYPPYYLEDNFNNFASLINRRPQTVVKPDFTSSETGNWPHHSRYEAEGKTRQLPYYNNNGSLINLKRTSNELLKNSPSVPPAIIKVNCTTTTTTTTSTTKRPLFRHPAFGFDFAEAPFRPIRPPHSGQPHFESVRRRSGLLLNNDDHQQPNPLKDSLLTSTSVNSHTRVKLNDVENEDDNDHQQNKENNSFREAEDSGHEYDRGKGGETESSSDGESEDSLSSAAEDDGNGPGGPNHDRERLQYLKDKGYAKHGWKNIYHKEEWGEQKKYHDIWRFKDWKDRFADKSPSASILRPSIVPAPNNFTIINQQPKIATIRQSR